MDLFKGIGKRVAQTAKNVGQITANATETVRMNTKIASLRDEINKLYTQIGKDYYEAHRQGTEADLATLCTCIDEFHAQIEQINAQLQEKSDVKTCPECGVKQSKEVKFCSECGSKLFQEPEAELKSPDVVINWPGEEPPKEAEEAETEPEQE